MMPDEQALVEAVTAEIHRAGKTTIRMDFDLGSMIVVIGQLQLALRHPSNQGGAAGQTRGLIDVMIANLRRRGFARCAEMAALGDAPEHDV